MANVKMTKSIKQKKQTYMDRIEDDKRAALNAIGITGKDAEWYLFWLKCSKIVEDGDVKFVHDNYDDLSDVLIFYCGKKPEYDRQWGVGFRRVSKKVFEFLKNYDENDLPAKKEYDYWWNSLQRKADARERKAQNIAEIKLSRDGEIRFSEIQTAYEKYFVDFSYTKMSFHKRTGVHSYSRVPEFTLKIKPVDYCKCIFNRKEFEAAMKNPIRTVEVSQEIIDYALARGVTANTNKSNKIELRYSYDGTNNRWYTSWKVLLPATSSNTAIKNAIDEFGSKRAKRIH